MGDTGKTRNLSRIDPRRLLCRIRPGAQRRDPPAPEPRRETLVDSTTGPATRLERVCFTGENRTDALNLRELDLAIR